ncbi:hypothetical protein BG004_003119, partial [Podila humilis]
MELPEIRRQVGLYLDTPDAYQCARVCRAWFDSFSPVCWVDFEFNMHQILKPDHEVIEKNAHHIRFLLIADHEKPAHFLDLCTNLRDLVLMFAVQDDHQWHQLANLVLRNKKLFSLNISTGGCTPTLEFIQAIAQNESIKEV